MSRLSRSVLPSLPESVRRPFRLPSAAGIIHLGIGAFHRAHQAVMTQAAIDAGDDAWGIVGASLRSADTRDAIAPQDGLYTVSVRADAGESLQVVGAVRDVLVAPEDPERLIAVMADPRIRIVSLTVTEKGYCHDPATGGLNESHPDIVHDLAHMTAPRSAPGLLLAAIARRRAARVPAFTVLCCDNLPSNGRTVHRVLARMADLVDPALGDHVRDNVACPSTMVDRIVPATTDEDRARIIAALGVSDAWPVVTEPFSQWVIEDDFPTGRPRWELGGAQFVKDVAPFELMKLRLLNGAHSSLAYLGLLLGHGIVAEASADPRLARFLDGLWGEIMPSVPPPPDTDLRAYCDQLLTRFRNTAIRHRLAQIAMDGSQKLPQRLLQTARENLAAGRPVQHIARAVAAFAVHASGVDADGRPIEVKDPLAAEMAAALTRLREEPDAAIGRWLAIQPIFGADLPAEAAFRNAVVASARRLLGGDPAAALA
ncbi:MAG: mannitol dehydrogenase family protein [Beijerinckiaceae bacterium]